MRRFLVLIVSILMLEGCFAYNASANDSKWGLTKSALSSVNSSSEYSFREDYDAIDRVAKSMFYVETYDKNLEYSGSASGFVAFDEHLFVTNQHVIDGASYLKVWDDDNNVYVIDKVIASDEKQDIALLLFDEGARYNSLDLRGDTELKRGQPVITIGSPKGYQNSVAFGNISAFPEEDGIRYIQFTAPISHGSSGGCLFDDDGKVIGITAAGVDEGQNIGFAIPIKLVQDLYTTWNKTDYIQLGTKRSWDTISIAQEPEIPLIQAKADSISAGVFINQYGVARCNTNIRSGPSTAFSLAGDSIRTGEYIYLIINEVNANGEMWSKVIVNGIEGFIKSENIYVLDEYSSQMYEKSNPTQAPVNTATPVQTPEPITADTLTPGIDVYRDGISKYNANMCSGPSADSLFTGHSIRAGDYVLIIKNEINSKGEIWSKVKVDGIEGYIRSKNIYLH